MPEIATSEDRKYDGWRMLAFTDGPRVRLISRPAVDHAESAPASPRGTHPTLVHARPTRRISPGKTRRKYWNMQTISHCTTAPLLLSLSGTRTQSEDSRMRSRGRFIMLSLVVVLSATGSSARETGSRADAARVPSTELSRTIVHSHKSDLPWAAHADIRERQMFAWMILLMKDGRGAR